MSEFKNQISEYRKGLIELEQKTQAEYDKAVMALSGGALGISLTFLKEIIGKHELASSAWLLSAWIAWGLSVTSTLFSYYTGILSLRRAVQQVDERSVYVELVGGKNQLVTKALNFCSGFLFFVGVVALVVFVSKNLP